MLNNKTIKQRMTHNIQGEEIDTKLQAILAEFERCHKTYFKEGGYVIDLPDNTRTDSSFEEVWHDGINEYVLGSTIEVKAFGKPLALKAYRPLKQIERFEFEQLFGFKPHCADYNSKKTVAVCPRYIVIPLAEAKELITKGYKTLGPDQFCIELYALMLVGGYVNSRQALIEMEAVIKDVCQAKGLDINPDNVKNKLVEIIKGKKSCFWAFVDI